MANTIAVKRGPYASIPTLAEGEVAYCPDKNASFIGTDGNGNKLLASVSHGTHSSRPTTPIPGQVYVSSDNPVVSVCRANNVWTEYVADVLMDADFGSKHEYEMGIYDRKLSALADAGRDVSIYLPRVSLTEGLTYTIIQANSTDYGIIIYPNKDDSGSIVGGGTYHELTGKYDNVSLLSDGTEWYIIL